jgi:hypothetical protein
MQPDGGPVSQIKGLLSRDIYSKKGELKNSSLLDRKRQKAACQRKSTTDKKERWLTLNSGVVAEGGTMTMTM